MLSRKGPKSSTATATLTPEEAVRRHQRLAEDHLQRAARGGRLDAETRHASMATAHAVLALLGHLQMRDADDAGLDLAAALAAEHGAYADVDDD